MSMRQASATDSPCRKCFWLRLVALLLWTAIILVLSLIPHPPKPPGLLGWDKLQHAGAYGLLAWLLARTLVLSPRWYRQAWWLAMTATIGFGILLEWLQWAMALGRSAEWLDMFADSLGALVACVVFRLTTRAKSRQSQLLDPPHG